MDAASAMDVLLVEDEQDARQAVAEILRLEGYSVSGARNGETALSMLRDGARPKLILLDLNMPVMDGWEFFREIEQDGELSQVPIGIITGAGVPQSIPTRKHDAGFLKKPVDIRRLMQMVRSHCGDRPHKS
jgi:CheY-like chemotaxis protein